MQLCPLGADLVSGKNLLIDLILKFHSLFQGYKVCDAKGRDCIEKNSYKTFNCSTSCVGIYADVQWLVDKVGEQMNEEEVIDDADEDVTQCSSKLLKRFASLEKEVKFLRSTFRDNEVESDEKKYKILLAEYRRFKAKNVGHFRFHPAARSPSFSKFYLFPLNAKSKIHA